MLPTWLSLPSRLPAFDQHILNSIPYILLHISTSWLRASPSHTHTHNMTMTLDTSQQRFGPSMNLDYQQHSSSPAFTNPWPSSSSPPQSAPPAGMFVGGQQPGAPLNPSMMAGKPQPPRPNGAYGSLPVTSGADMMSMNRAVPPTSTPYGSAAYTASASPVNGQFAPSGPGYEMGYAPAPSVRPGFGMEAERKYDPAA